MGCLERRVAITSEPPGAIIYANDVELGRTPLEADFTYYGKYDVRVELEGYEPLRTKASANAPLYEVPPFDLVAMAIPAEIETTVRWHFVLQPAAETGQDPVAFEKDLLTRAHDLRERLGPPHSAEPKKDGAPAEGGAKDGQGAAAPEKQASGAETQPSHK